MIGDCFLLGTLHQLHCEMDFYSLADLHSIVKYVQPEVICVELSQSMLEEGRRLEHKIETFDVLLPLRGGAWLLARAARTG